MIWTYRQLDGSCWVSFVNIFSFIIILQVDDVLETKLGRSFQLVMDKGTLDAIGLHPDFPVKRLFYDFIYDWNF